VSTVFLILFLMGFSQPSGGPERLLAQAFEVDVEEDAEDIEDIDDVDGEEKQDRPKQVKSEEDLWTEPDKAKPKPEKKPKKEEEDVEEITDEEGKEESGGDVGGWGAEAERDTWGDEERIEKGESLMGKTGEPDRVLVKEQQKEAAQPVKSPARPEKEKAEEKAEKAEEKKEEKTKEELVSMAMGPEKVLPVSGTLADLAAIWEQRRIHLDQRDFGLARADLKRFLDLKDELYIRNMFLHANVLIREADRARQAEDQNKAEHLLDAAVEMAPDFAGAHLARTSFWFSKSTLKIGRVLGGLVDAAKASYRNPMAADRFLVNLVTGLLLGLGLAAVIFIVVQFLRCVRLYLHDFHHLFPRGVARLQTGFLGVLVLLIPILFRLGLLSVLFFWALIAWIYQERRERLVTFLVVLFFALSPFALKWVVSGMIVPDSVTADLLAVAQGPADSRSISRLKSRLRKEPGNHVILATLGGLYKRTGNLDLAAALLDRALQIRSNSAVLLNNRGNVRFLGGDLKGAIGFYDRAIQARPDLAVPYYNLSKAYYRSLDLNKGKHYRTQALRLDPEGIGKVNKRAESRRANDVVADLAIPIKWVAGQNHRRDGEMFTRAARNLWLAWGGTGSSDTFPFVGAGVVVFFGLILLMRKKVYFSSGCVRCGRPACRRCSIELRDDTVCAQCFHAFVQREQGIDAKSRISKEIQVRQYRRRKENIARGITFLLPGVGQLIHSRPLRGMLFLMVFCCVIVQVLLGHGVMRDAMALGVGIDWLKLVPLIVLGLGFYAWAILNVFRSET
jgi:tetratricopeptide (TPR) repeat protein